MQLILPTKLNVYADHNMIDCVFRNLLGNAIKFTPIGGSISISAQEKENEIEFFIQDSGVGMTNNQIEDIKKGVQFTTRGTNREKGRGFGTPGKGSVFSFRLPKPPIT